MSHVLRFVLILTAVAGIAVIGALAAPIVQTRIAVHRLASPDPAVRKRGLSYLRDEREVRGLEDVLKRVEGEEEPALVELAAYTAMRMRDRRAVPILRQRADREPDSALRARLILYAARLGDDTLVSWLRAGVESGEPWRQAGSSVGLVHLGRTEGGDAVLSLAETLPAEPREFVRTEFRTVAEVMSQVVGYGLPGGKQVSHDEVWPALSRFWRQYARAGLLDDVLNRLSRSDPDWREVERLLHARERASRWLE